MKLAVTLIFIRRKGHPPRRGPSQVFYHQQLLPTSCNIVLQAMDGLAALVSEDQKVMRELLEEDEKEESVGGWGEV